MTPVVNSTIVLANSTQLGTVMGAASMYAGQINAVMGYTSTAFGIYAFATYYPKKQRYLLRWLAAIVIVLGLLWGAKATHDYHLILLAMREPSALISVYEAAALWPIGMYIYTAMASIILVMLMSRKLLQVHKIKSRVLTWKAAQGIPAAEQHEETRVSPHTPLHGAHVEHDVDIIEIVTSTESNEEQHRHH